MTVHLLTVAFVSTVTGSRLTGPQATEHRTRAETKHRTQNSRPGHDPEMETELLCRPRLTVFRVEHLDRDPQAQSEKALSVRLVTPFGT